MSEPPSQAPVNHAYILLGSNIDPATNVPAAMAMLRARLRVLAVSPVYETLPVGLTKQPNFVNAAIHMATDHDLHTLKEAVLAPVEQALRRRRGADRNAPRTMDLDIVLFLKGGSDATFVDDDIGRFAHVAVPLADLRPFWLHPATGEPLRAMATRLLATAVAENDGRLVMWPLPDWQSLVR